MKKNNFFQWVLFLCLGISWSANAQTIVNMPLNTGPLTFTIAPPGTCSFNFFDNGGAAANYSANSGVNSIATFAPSNPATHRIVATFSALQAETTFDALYVHNGATVASPLIPGPATTVVAGAGGWNAGTPSFTSTDPSGALTFRFRSDASVQQAGWSAVVAQVPLTPCGITAPAALGNFGTNPATACSALVNVAAPVFAPAGCNTALSLQYRLNGGAPIMLGAVVPATIPIALPLGPFSVTWELVDPCGNVVVSSATSTGTVVDDDAPMITCPANVTLNLAPGECRIPYTYAIVASDNCPFAGPLTMSQTHGSSGVNNNNFATISFAVKNDGAVPIRVTGFFANLGGFPGPAFTGNVDTRVSYGPINGAGSATGVAAIGTWTPGAVQPIAVNVTTYYQPTLVSLPAAEQFLLQPGEARGIAITSTNGAFMRYANGNQTTTDGTLTIISNGHWAGGNVATLGNTPRLFKGAVQYQQFLPVIPVTQTSGLASGSQFEIGTTTNCFTATDAAGLVANCCFTVTVQASPTATDVLTCNSLVNISLDQTCTAAIGADQILAGGNYRCYDLYVVEIDRTGPNYMDGPWVPAIVNSTDINKTRGVRVTDPATGNQCWGNIYVEDKLPPTIVCRPLNLECGEPIPNVPAPALTGPQLRLAQPFEIINGVAGQSPRVYNFDYTNIPVGTPTLDVNVRLKLTGHTWLPDLDVQVINPAGQVVSVMTIGGCVGQEWPIDVWFDDEGTYLLMNACARLNAGGQRMTALTAGVPTPNKLAALDGTNAGGTWQIRVTDNDPLDDGIIEEIGLEVTVNLPAVAPADNCSVPTVSFVDTRVNGSCALGFSERITRKWTATDASGLTATCNQIITIGLPDPGDVVAPPNYDDIDEPALLCASAPLSPAQVTPDYLEGLGLQGYPYINGAPVGCTLGSTWSDAVVLVCDGTYKIRREWHVIDWCTGGDDEYIQIIKVIDNVSPTLVCPADMTVSTGPNNCLAVVNLPDIIVADGCSRMASASAMIIGINPVTGDTIGMFPVAGTFSNFPGNNLWNRDTLAVFGSTPGLPVGKHSVWLSITDDCGNISNCDFDLVVLDLNPPVAVCDEHTVVSVGYDDVEDCYLPNADDCTFAGVTWVKAASFDDGSYDNCGNIRFTVRRMPLDTQEIGAAPNTVLHPVYSTFIDQLNGANGTPNCFRYTFPSNLCTVGTHSEGTINPDIAGAFPSEYAVATGYYGNMSITTCDMFPAPIPGFPQNFSILSYPYTPIRSSAVNYQCNVIPYVPGDFIFDMNGNPALRFPGVALIGQDSIKFYCDEVGTTQMVILRVYQLDNNGFVQLDQLGEAIYNECMVEIEVADKIRPTCASPANVTVSCENFDPSLWAYGTATPSDNCCLDVTKVYNGTKGITHSVNYSQFDTVCNRGVITRTFRAYDCAGLSSQCTQRITVQYNQDYFLHLPGDRIVYDCDITGNYGEPVIFDEDCELVGTSFEDELITVVPDACYKIIRTWRISNWCTYNPDLPCVQIPNPNPNAIVNHPSNLNAPFLKVTPFSAGNLSVPVDFRSTLVSITPGAPQTDYTSFYTANANCYEYSQVIKIIDNIAPVIDNCPAAPVAFSDITPNDGNLWNDPFFNDPIHNIHDLCEMPVDLNVVASDICAGTNVKVRYLLFLDTDNSGDMETVVNSLNPPAYGFINVGNAGNVNYGGGQALRFDKRPVPANQVWRFGLQEVVANGKKTARVGFNTLAAPNTYVLPQLPHGRHKIKWLVSDGCGNETACEYIFEIKDGKAPTVVCLNGISVNIMPTGMIEIWDTELLQYTEDNCTPTAQLKTAICKTCTSFPVDAQGNPIKSVIFTCSELGTRTVRIWSIDASGNADYCETYVLVQDNNGNCGTVNKMVAGNLTGKDKSNVPQGLQDADIQVVGSHPAIPTGISKNAVSNNAGHYEINNALPILSNFTITPVKDDNYTNGVDVIDVLKIQRHILGQEPLSSPYRMISADVNNSGSITSNDIVELRKLILGAYTELPNVASYRFVDAKYVFPNPNNPFVPQFPEIISVADLQDNYMSGNFEVAKMGDVTGNADLNNLMSADDRTVGTLLFDIADRKVAKGEEVTVEFTTADRVLGYQFTMNAKGLDILDVVPGANMNINNFAVFASKGAMTTVVEEAAAKSSFSVKFRATEAGELSKMLSVSSAITKAVAYSTESERFDVSFRFNGQGGSVISGVGFELYQNQPNPFINNTVVGFHLPEAATATFSVYDELGRTLFTQKGDFSKGYNAITIERSKLNATGVLFYTLETSNQSATKQMIQTK
jgi:hypothetical protein